MANVLDVAAYILRERGEMSTMKLQKLCYYSKAWHLVWDAEPLFPERFEAWANGPVAPVLYREHRRQFTVSPGAIPGNPDALNAAQKASVDAVLEGYGSKPAYELSAMTHRERPWIEARGDLAEGERCTTPIDEAAMQVYYEALAASVDS